MQKTSIVKLSEINGEINATMVEKIEKYSSLMHLCLVSELLARCEDFFISSNAMRWLGLFTNKTFRKHRELISPHRDFIICIVPLAIFHPHFVLRIFSSAFFHPAFFHPPSAIRPHPPPCIRSALYRDPFLVAILSRNQIKSSFNANFK